MPAGLEREIKLPFPSADTARAAVLALGATPSRPRRLQDDALYDSEHGMLRAARSVLRVRMEDGQSRLTFKGAPQASRMKVREEIETLVDDGATLHLLLERLGFRVWFRYQKYREEFTTDGVVVAVDETPIGVYVEIEGTEAGVDRVATALGRGTDGYVLDSYYRLFAEHCERRGEPVGHMVFTR